MGRLLGREGWVVSRWIRPAVPRHWIEIVTPKVSNAMPAFGSYVIALVFGLSGALKLKASLLSETWSDGPFSEKFLIAIALLEIALALEWSINTTPLVHIWRVTLVLAIAFFLGSLITPLVTGLKCGCFGGVRNEELVRVSCIGLIFFGLVANNKRCVRFTGQAMDFGNWRWPLISLLMLSIWYPWIASTHGQNREYFGLPMENLMLESSARIARETHGDWKLDLGTIVVGTETGFDLDVRNLGNRKVKLKGSWRSCSCISIDGFPSTVLPKEAGNLKGRFKSPVTPGEYEFRVELFTDQIGQSKIGLTVLCTAVAESKP
jgi:hypothetical protein